MVIEYSTLIIAGGASALITYILQVKYKLGAVRASALVGVVAGLFVFLWPEILPKFLMNNLPIVAFGASFIGMASSKVVNNYILIVFSGCVFALIFLNTSDFFNGFGGGLGITACIALLITLSLPVLKEKGRFSEGFIQLGKLLKGRAKR